MVIRKVRPQRTAQRLFIKDDHMVETFSSNRADDSFHVSALPRRPGSAEDFLDIHDCHLVAELLSIDPIAISQQISRHCIEWKSFDHLLCGPFGRRMSRHVEVDNTSSIMCEDDKHKKHFKPNGVDGEEVDGSKLGNVIVEECPPRLGRRFRTPDHVFGNRRLGDLDAQLHQLALNPGVRP